MSDIAQARPGGDLRYQAVARVLADEIRTGRLGDRVHLPSERALVSRFGVSRVTVRRALRALEAEGLVTSAAGRGWLVRSTGLEEPENELLGFTDVARRQGLAASARVLAAHVREATLDEAELLGMAPGARVVELDRVRLLDGVPVGIDRSLVPAARAPGLLERDWTTASLYAALEEAGCPPVRAEYVLQAAAADEPEATLLELSPGAPVLRAEQRSFDATGRPIQLCRMSYRGDRYRFRTTLIRRA